MPNAIQKEILENASEARPTAEQKSTIRDNGRHINMALEKIEASVEQGLTDGLKIRQTIYALILIAKKLSDDHQETLGREDTFDELVKDGILSALEN